MCETQPVRSENFLPFSDYVMLMRKDITLSLLFRTASDGKLGGAWERGYVLPFGSPCKQHNMAWVNKWEVQW